MPRSYLTRKHWRCLTWEKQPRRQPSPPPGMKQNFLHTPPNRDAETKSLTSSTEQVVEIKLLRAKPHVKIQNTRDQVGEKSTTYVKGKSLTSLISKELLKMETILLTKTQKTGKRQASSYWQLLWKHTTRFTCLLSSTQFEETWIIVKLAKPIQYCKVKKKIIIIIKKMKKLPWSKQYSLLTCKHSSCTPSSVVRTRESHPLYTLRSALTVLLSGGATLHSGSLELYHPAWWGSWLFGKVSDPTLKDICPQPLQPWPAGHWDPTLVPDCSPDSDHSCDVVAAFSVSPVLSHSSELCHHHALISVVLVPSLSHVWPFCHPMDCNQPGSSVHGVFRARILEWVVISFSRGSFWPRDRTPHLLHWQAGSLPLSHLGSPPSSLLLKFFLLLYSFKD